ncbi:MAG TPA: hypothetical protein VI319_15355 [Burkholderiales bacterium]
MGQPVKTRPILNVADVELMPRPPQFAPKGEAAERYEARVGFIGKPRRLAFIGHQGKGGDYWEGE